MNIYVPYYEERILQHIIKEYDIDTEKRTDIGSLMPLGAVYMLRGNPGKLISMIDISSIPESLVRTQILYAKDHLRILKSGFREDLEKNVERAEVIYAAMTSCFAVVPHLHLPVSPEKLITPQTVFPSLQNVPELEYKYSVPDIIEKKDEYINAVKKILCNQILRKYFFVSVGYSKKPFFIINDPKRMIVLISSFPAPPECETSVFTDATQSLKGCLQAISRIVFSEGLVKLMKIL